MELRLRKAIAIGVWLTGAVGILCACSQDGAAPAGPLAEIDRGRPPRVGSVGSLMVNLPGSIIVPAGGDRSAAPTNRPAVNRMVGTTPAVETPADHAVKGQVGRPQSGARLWGEWDKVLSRGNLGEIARLAAALGEGLRAPGTEVVYDAIERRLYDPNTRAEEVDSLIDVRQQAATPRSLATQRDYQARVAAEWTSGGGEDLR